MGAMHDKITEGESGFNLNLVHVSMHFGLSNRNIARTRGPCGPL